MRWFSHNGFFWLDEAEGILKMGLTKEAIAAFGCMHVFIPRAEVGSDVAVGAPLASVEGSKALSPIKSPLYARLDDVDPEAVTAPYDISVNKPLWSFVSLDDSWKNNFQGPF